MLTLDTRTAIAAHTVQHGGGTFEARTGALVTPTSGYAVGLPGGRQVKGLLTQNAVVDALRGFDLTRAPYVGTWVDTNSVGNRVAYVDPVVILPDRASALILAEALGELAVWDFSASAEIRVHGQAA